MEQNQVITFVSTIAAVASAAIALFAWRQAGILAKRDRQITVEDLYDTLTEQVDDIIRTNTGRWNACASTFEIAGRTKSGLFEKEKSAWEHDKSKLLSAIEDLKDPRKIPSSYERMKLDDLSRYHRALRKIERVFHYERAMHEKW
jgi:hypothetical protein